MVPSFKSTRHRRLPSAVLGLELQARSRGMKMVLRKVKEQPKTTWQELVDGLKATVTSVTKKTVANTQTL